MLRVKIPIGNEKNKILEAEGETEAELEASVRVALRVAASMSLPSASQTRSHIIVPDDEDKKAGSVEVPAKAERERSAPSEPERDETITQQPHSRDLLPHGYMRPNYDGLSNHDRLCLAVCDLNVNYAEDEPSAAKVLRHLEDTGGKFETKAKKPVTPARNSMRENKRVISTGKGWRATEETVRDFAARGLLWVPKTQTSAESGQERVDPEVTSLEVESGVESGRRGNEEVSRTSLVSPSFNSLKS